MRLADGSTVNYERDPLGRLVRRRAANAWGATTRDRRYGYEDATDRVVVEGDYNTWFSWWLNWYVVYLGGPDGLVADSWGRHYLSDPHGNVVATRDGAGAVTGTWGPRSAGHPLGPRPVRCAQPCPGLAQAALPGERGAHNLRGLS